MLNRNFLVGLGIGGTGPHRHWRIYCTASGSASFIAGEIEMRAAPGGADQCSGGTASASSNSGSAGAAFDNSTSSAWISGGALPQWIAYDFVTPVSVGEILISLGSSYSGFEAALPTNFSVQHSDNGTDWTSAKSFTGVTWGSVPTSQTFQL